MGSGSQPDRHSSLSRLAQNACCPSARMTARTRGHRKLSAALSFCFPLNSGIGGVDKGKHLWITQNRSPAYWLYMGVRPPGKPIFGTSPLWKSDLELWIKHSFWG